MGQTSYSAGRGTKIMSSFYKKTQRKKRKKIFFLFPRYLGNRGPHQHRKDAASLKPDKEKASQTHVSQFRQAALCPPLPAPRSAGGQGARSRARTASPQPHLYRFPLPCFPFLPQIPQLDIASGHQTKARCQSLECESVLWISTAEAYKETM